MKTIKTVSLIAFLFCFTLNLRAQSGTCGANLTWELTDSTLTISGSGAMDNSHPWSSYSSQIARVSLPEGLTNICNNAFDQCSNLQSIIIPNTVTSIGYSAFSQCTSLKQVTLGNAIETIGSHAFHGTSITSITLPSSVTSIEDYAFSYCKKLTEITIPGSVSSIGNHAFQYCEQLSKATIEEGVKSIGYNAFQSCYKITDISLPSSLISIGSSAFSSCSALASVVIPEQITTIEASTFSHCSSLKEVTLPDNLQTIGDNAFYSCSFTHIDIPHSVASLGYSAFSGCDNLTSVTLPNSITNIPRNAFSGCSNLTSVTIPEGVITIGCSAFSYCNLLNLSLPNSLQTIENGAEYSDNGAFEGNKNLIEVTIPDNVTALGAYTFEGCTALSRVTLPDGLLSIGACTFQNCTSLRTISFGADLLTIGENAFENCSALSSVAIPDKVSIIPEYAFYNCSVLSQVSLPKQLATIEVAAFMNCKSLSSIILPEGLTTIEGAAFYDCNLTNLLLPQSLRTIGEGVVTIGAATGNYHGVFEKNSNLTTITIPQSVNTLGSDAFAECTALSQVTLSEGLSTIGARAFYNCSALKAIQLPKSINSLVSAFSHCGLEEIEIPENVLILDGTFYECNKLTKVILPSSLTTIDDNSFYNCTSLTSITLPQTVRFIGSSAFYGCKSLSQINLPQEITTIEGGAFERCSALREMTIPNKITKIASSTFANCGSLVSIFLPRNISTIESYAFEYCTSLTELVLPDSLKSIGDYSCFRGCSALRSLTIPSSVTTLGQYLFEGCISLSSVTMLPPTPPTIYRTFDGAPSTLKINLLCGTKEAYMANANWAALTYPLNEISSNILTVKSNDNRMGEAYIPTPNTCDNNTAIIEALPREGYQFAAWHDGNTDNPRTIIVTQDTTYIANFEPLTTYQLTVNYDPKQGHISGIGEYYPNEEATLTVTPLGGYRFKQWGDGNTDNPRTIIMTQDTTLEALFIMGDYCGDDILYTFLNDTLALNGTGDMWNLSQYGWNMYADEVLALTLSNGITSIGTNAFMNLMFLPEVTIPASVKTIHKRAFENCRSLSSVTFAPNSQLQTIDHWAFYECINLKALEIPEGVTTIGNGAFYGCAYLDSIVLPASMMSIADNGFAQCTKLSAMTVHAITPPAVDAKTFENVNRAIPVYVPFGTGATYRATPIWQEFDIREMEAEIGSSCEAPIEVELDYTDRIEGASEVWYTLWTYDLPVKIHFTPDADNSSWGPEIQIDYTCSPGFYDDPKIEAMMNELSGFGMAMPIELIFDPIINDGKTEWTTSINQSYREQLQQYGITYNVGMYIKITYFEAGEISFTQECENVYTEFDAKFCGSFTWNGVEYTEPGDYIQTYTKANGCDSIVTMHLTKDCPCEDIFVDFEVTACDSYEWNGQTYTQSGDYVYTTTAANGCDSIVTLHLTINRTEVVEFTDTACDSYVWNGITYTESGDYIYETECRKEILHLTINRTEVVEFTDTACDSYVWNGITYTESGDYTYSTTTAAGCEHVEVLHLTINESKTTTFETEVTICEGESYTWTVNGITYENLTAGVYSYADTTMYDCSMEINTLLLTIEDCAPPCEDVATEEYATICYGETFTWNGQSYSTTGEYTQTLSTTAGCDSIVTLYLTVLPETIIVEENVTINEEYLPYTWRNQQCYSAGTYNESIPFANYPYCDSVIYVLNLIVDAPNKCGDHLYWHYSNNTMTITGYGAMYDDPDILSYRTQDWYPARVNNIVLPEAITHIGNVAFADCANLTSIVIPSSVTSIGDGAFSWTGLQSVTIPASVTELGEQVFETCNDLRTILYEGNPIAINNQTVHPLIGCVHLDTIIAHAALWHCTTADPALEARYGVPHKARYIEVTDGELTNQAIKYIANNNASVQILDLTNTTNTTLPYGAWSNSYQLSTLYLPQQIEVIPESMVEGARNLSEIAIPATVMEIGNYAFSGCVNVWRMTVEAVIPPKVYENTFDGISRSISVQVPAGSEELYREAAYWREFFIEHTNTPSPISNCQKLLRKDQILILRNGKVYTTMGQLITNE